MHFDIILCLNIRLYCWSYFCCTCIADCQETRTRAFDVRPLLSKHKKVFFKIPCSVYWHSCS